LVLTDIATGWTEFAPLLVREQRLLTEVPSEIRKLLPFPLGRRREAVLKGAREMKEQGGFTWVRDALPTTDLKAVFGA
jgi:hypothetical protein